MATVTPANTLSAPRIAPEAPSPRFTLELEFVLCLSNPYYLSHLALTYPHLLNPPRDQENPTGKPFPNPSHELQQESTESDAAKFAAYLSYLYEYWRRPEYARFLTHPGATLRNLELLQQEKFRQDIIRPDVIERLLVTGDSTSGVDGEGDEDREGGKEEEGQGGEQVAAVTAELETTAQNERQGETQEEGQEVSMDVKAG